MASERDFLFLDTQRQCAEWRVAEMACFWGLFKCNNGTMSLKRLLNMSTLHRNNSRQLSAHNDEDALQILLLSLQCSTHPGVRTVLTFAEKANRSVAVAEAGAIALGLSAHMEWVLLACVPSRRVYLVKPSGAIKDTLDMRLEMSVSS